ncbi:dihydromonapterin reductase [Pseudoalteromonas denitrificans]|uniref:Dihydromonapterin reductase n=1 Tax=Pseudoalteromonas denitrificans DSM 6059 TaxID=1123010 RepID=A0A1I1MA23_9GAMM|nr:dihydromonapterin reductase [Pseudoalteromonas denitrificans]SFC82189.1 dihydromonapterin reductase / dihydrofolate reductase [Pseudoalteromonas denitrificans DSM 6059]
MTSPILITGAGQRIGLAIAHHLLRQGHDLILSYRTQHAEIQELESLGAICIQANFIDNASIDHFINQIKQHTSCLRGIIHNASSWDCEKNNPDFASLFDDMMRIHAKVPYLINLACSKLLTVTPDKTDIVHLTDYVVETGSPKHIAYAASKAALDNMTKSFASKLAPQVKVNAIAPSLIIFNQNDDEEYKAKTLKKSLMEIEPGSKEILNCLDMLLSSSYITGRTIQVDGGRHLK